MKLKSPREMARTIRQQMIEILPEELTALDISQALGIRKKEVYGHLTHIARSTATQKHKLRVTPCTCLQCGYRFTDRKRLTPPGRCPKCRNSHRSPASFSIK